MGDIRPGAMGTAGTTIPRVNDTPRPPAPHPDADAEGGDAPPGGRRRALWGALAAVVVVGLTVMLVVGIANKNVSHELDEAVARGDRPEAPAFTLPVLAGGGTVKGPEGRPVSLADLRGSVVVVNFWASWCDPCKNEAPLLQALAERQARNGVVVLGIDVQDVSQDAKDFMRTYGMTYPSLRDRNDDVKNAYAATGVPETFVIDRSGRIAFIHRSELAADQLDQLDAIVAGVARETQEPTP